MNKQVEENGAITGERRSGAGTLRKNWPAASSSAIFETPARESMPRDASVKKKKRQSRNEESLPPIMWQNHPQLARKSLPVGYERRLLCRRTGKTTQKYKRQCTSCNNLAKISPPRFLQNTLNAYGTFGAAGASTWSPSKSSPHLKGSVSLKEDPAATGIHYGACIMTAIANGTLRNTAAFFESRIPRRS